MSGIDLIDAARGAVFDAIDAGLASSGATALDYVEQDTNPPFVQIGEIEWTNEGDKDDIALRLSIDVITIYRGADRAELLKIMHANFLALQDVVLEVAGAVLSRPELVGGSASNAAGDGVTFAGLQTFTLLAELA